MTRDQKGRKSGLTASPSASPFASPDTGTRSDKHFLEKIMEQWNNPEERVKLLVIANIVAFGMLIMGVLVLILLMMGYIP